MNMLLYHAGFSFQSGWFVFHLIRSPYSSPSLLLLTRSEKEGDLYGCIIGFGNFRNAGRTSGISEIQSVSVEILVTLSNANPCFRTWIILCVVYNSVYFLNLYLRHYVFDFTAYRFLPFLTTNHSNATLTALFYL